LNVVEYYKKYQRTFPERRAKEDLMLIWLPKTWHGQLTLNNLTKLGKRYFSFVVFKSRVAVEGELLEQSIPKSYWVLATKETIPRSERMNNAQQQGIFDVLSQGAVFRCNLPSALEAGVCFFAQSLIRKDNACSVVFTVCQERIEDQQVIAGCCVPANCIPSIPIVGLYCPLPGTGAIALWRFSTGIHTQFE